LTNVDIKAI